MTGLTVSFDIQPETSHITDSGQLLYSYSMAAGHGATVIPGKHVTTPASKNKTFWLFYLRFVNMITAGWLEWEWWKRKCRLGWQCCNFMDCYLVYIFNLSDIQCTNGRDSVPVEQPSVVCLARGPNDDMVHKVTHTLDWTYNLWLSSTEAQTLCVVKPKHNNNHKK